LTSVTSVAGRATRFGPALRLAKRIGREPLVHFLIIGALLFAGLQIVRTVERPTVRISEQDLNQLVAYWQMQSGRPPTRPELQAILRDRIDEELLAREAQRLGLGKDDLIIRRRLAQKMAFASEDVGAIAEPGEPTLRAWYAAHPAQYAMPTHIALRQAFFSGDRGAEAAREAASAALAAARRGEAPIGDPFVLPLTYADASLDDLTRDYGPDYARAVQAAPLGAWTGPVASAYGMHVIRVESRQGAATAPFEQVRADVRDAWLAERRAANNATFLAALRKRYRVVVAGTR
jgi:peptidyl-prolyl cis-trans isomerase C